MDCAIFRHIWCIFIPLFLTQVEALLLPFFITVAWGYILGRAIAHILGENSLFNNNSSRATVLGWSMTPFLILLAYFALLDGESAVTGVPAIILKIVVGFSIVWVVQRIVSWLNRTNADEDAERRSRAC